MPHINIEIKAKHENITFVRNYLKEQKADFKGIDHQIDTYFQSSNGRLKLREGNIENHLIFYERNNQAGPKQSDVILFDNTPGSSLKEILTKSIGTKVIVDKKREIYFIENVKFHVDEVKGLGNFIEIEAIADNGNISREKLLEQCNYYMEQLQIKSENLLTNSYSDMLLEKK